MTDRPWQLTPEHHRAGRPRWLRSFACWCFRRAGWSFEGAIPEQHHVVLVVGPHTSNWDFIVAVLAMLALDIQLHYLAKHSLFRPPLGRLLRSLGGIPVDRSNPRGFAESAAERIRQADSLILAITPEGTRSKVPRLKTGFSRIARQVPCLLMPVLLDFGGRTIHLLPAEAPGETPEHDADHFRRYFASVRAKRPENF